MGHDDGVELVGVVHDAAHHAGVLDAVAVVGEHGRAVGVHVAHVGEHLALQVFGAGAGHHDAALPHGRGAGLHVFHGHGVVDHRARVRPGAHRGETTVGRRTGTRGDVLLLLLARIAEVHVHVHEAGSDDLAGKIALDALLHGEVVSHLHDLAVADEDVGHFVQADLGVDQTSVLKHQCHRCYLLGAGTGRPCARGRRRKLGRG